MPDHVQLAQFHLTGKSSYQPQRGVKQRGGVTARRWKVNLSVPNNHLPAVKRSKVLLISNAQSD